MAKQNKPPKIMILKRPVNWMLSSGASIKVDTSENEGIIQLNGLVSEGELFNVMELTFN